MDDFVVYRNRFRMIYLSLITIILLFGGTLMLIYGLSEQDWAAILLGGAFFISFGYCAYLFIKQIFSHDSVLLRLTKEGFYDYSSATATDNLLIPWSSVAKITEKNIFNQIFISVYLKQPDEVLGKATFAFKKASKANVAMGFGEINIVMQTAKKYSVAEVMQQMQNYLDATESLD